MPCYCQTSDEVQDEIRSDIRLRMFYDGFRILSISQRLNLVSGNIFYPSVLTPDDLVNDSLCKLCKIISREQMISIDAYTTGITWDYKNLWDWYEDHCKHDEELNRIITSKEYRDKYV